MQVKMINDRPVKIWADEVEDSAMEQIANLTTLPFLYHHLAIMPDVHTGKGMPIGGVLACVNAVIPNAVGVDIGCGMCAVKTNWHVADISTEVLRKRIMRGIRKRIPLGKNHHKLAQDESLLPQGHDIDKLEIVKRRQVAILKEIGTLGGGNHFIELQKDEEGLLWIMIHSGSRTWASRWATTTTKGLPRSTSYGTLKCRPTLDCPSCLCARLNLPTIGPRCNTASILPCVTAA